MSNNLSLTELATSQSSKETTINDIFAEVDAAVTESFAADVTSADVTLTDAQYRGCAVIVVSGATTAGRTVTLPAVKRPVLLISDSANTADVTIAVGTTTATLTAGAMVWAFTDGSANGLRLA